MNLIAIAVLLFAALLLPQPTSIPEPVPAYDRLSIGHQRLLDKVAQYYWTAPNGSLWCNQVEGEGIGNTRRMNDDAIFGRQQALQSYDAPLWYHMETDIRRKSRQEVLVLYVYIANSDVYARRRAFGEQEGKTIVDRCIVVDVPVSGPGIMVNFIRDGEIEDRLVWLSNHPKARNATPGDTLSMDSPITLSNRQAWVDGDPYEHWIMDTKINLNKEFPTTKITDLKMSPVSPQQLAEVLEERGLTRLPVWKMVKVMVKQGTADTVRKSRSSRGGVSFVTSTRTTKGEPSEYEWHFKLTWKPIRISVE